MFTENIVVYLAPGATDLRKSINGLSAIAQDVMMHNVFNGALFGFCNRKRSLIKVVYWDKNGFCLWMKHLEQEKFPWPNEQAKSVKLSSQQFRWLLDGLSIHQSAHKKLNYKTCS